MAHSDWSGRRAQQARAWVEQTRPRPWTCYQCGRNIGAEQEWVVEHVVPRIIARELTWQTDNWAVSHRACSDASTSRVLTLKGKYDAYIDIGLSKAEAIERLQIPESPGFSRDVVPKDTAARPFSPSSTSADLPEIREALRWQAWTTARKPWSRGLVRVPGDSAPPLAMTGPHPDAVDSYGPEACRWIEAALGITLRWWQKLSLTRLLEYREDGTLCWRTILLSAPRRAGKSIIMLGLALWRMAHAELIGEVQQIVHLASDLNVARNIQSQAYEWAEDVANWKVTIANGKEAITADDRSQWVVRASAHSYSPGLGIADECWDIEPRRIDDGLEPATLERLWPQLFLISTANRRATSLMRRRISAALEADDGHTLLLLWAAPPDADIRDRATWKAASPWWSEDRELLIEQTLTRALAGEDMPELDDPDPVMGFRSEYLNQWRLSERRAVPGDPVISGDAWNSLAVSVPFGDPDGAALESWYDSGVSLALAWKAGERVIVDVTEYDSLGEAVDALKAAMDKPRAKVGASLKGAPELKGVRSTAVSGRTGNAVQDLAGLLRDDVLRHTGSEFLSGQVLDVRTKPSADGLRIVSKTRSDAIKAAVWAAQAARKPKAQVMVVSSR